MTVWVCFGGHHKHLSLGCSCLPAGRKGRWGIGRWKGWNSFRSFLQVLLQGIIRGAIGGEKPEADANGTWGHHVVILALPVCLEELLSLQAFVAATSWACFSLPKWRFWWRGAAFSKLPWWYGKLVCCHCSQFRAFTSTKSTAIENKIAGRPACRCAVWDSKYVSQMGADRSSAERGHYFNFNSCFSPKIHGYPARSAGKPWTNPVTSSMRSSPAWICVCRRNKGRYGQSLKGFLLPTASMEPSHALQPSPTIHFETKQALNIYFQRSLPGGLNTSVGHFCNIIPTSSALYLVQIGSQR